MRSTRALLLVTVLLLAPAAVRAQAALIDGLGGPAGYGTSCLGPNDDGSSRMIDLTPIFPTGLQFFDRTHTVMFVNTNGNVTFGEGVAAYTPAAFPIANQPMIAPYWADVDVRPAMGTNCGGYPDGSGRPEYTYAGDCMSPTENGVWWHLDTAGRRVIVTWDRVGYYKCHNDRDMTFQLILTATGAGTCGGGGDFDVEFRYEDCEWTTGDASGGMNGAPRPDAACVRVGPQWVCPLTGQNCGGGGGGGTRTCSAVPAQAGFDAGNTMDFVEIMGSRTGTIGTTLCTMSNVAMPGIWRFSIRSGVVECPNAGDACSTGMPGVCGPGREQCVGGGVECRPEVPASAERCDGLDNDCNGMVDDGDLCAALEICDRGVCLATCFEGGCPAGQACTTEGRCVDAGCETMTCPDGERCVAGACVAACDGVTCPAGQECRAGRCLDLCEGATCDECTVCESGDCVPSCEFAACPAGQTCLEDGHCVADACATVSCDPGFVCVAGACTDACEGAMCPAGERCEMGECVGAPRPDGGPPVRVDAGPVPRPDGGVIPMMDGGTTNADGGSGPAPEDGGCGCRAGAGRGHGGLALLALGLLGLALRRRR